MVHDLQTLLSSFRNLRAVSEIYTSNEGNSDTLVKVEGTIPITYRQATYNIPVEIWITQSYPLSRPLVYVKPTSSMIIVPNHENVAPDGTVFLPYLNQWTSNRSNLRDLAEACCATFSRVPPVRSKPAEPARGFRGPSNGHTHGPAFSPQQPPPPYSTGQPPPPYPVFPPSGAARKSNPPSYGGAQGNAQARVDDEEAVKRRVKEAVRVKLERKLIEFYKQVRVSVDREFEIQRKLKKGEDELMNGQKLLKSQAEELQEVIDSLAEKKVQVLSWLELNEGSNSASAKAEVNIDEAVLPADKWSQQLFDNVSKTSAIEDCLYHLDRALSNDAIDLKTFLKEVRKLAPQQFMAKALAIKIMKLQQEEKSRHR